VEFYTKEKKVKYQIGMRGMIQMTFAEAVNRKLNKKICMKCYAKNPPNATRCRRCGYTGLRPKRKERKGT